MEFPLLILDLDETLIWAREEAATTFDFKVFSYFVSKRPHLEEFLQRVRLWYRIAVWTSSGEEYAQQVIGHIFGEDPGLEFIWTSSRCTMRFDPEECKHRVVKDLKKVKRRGYSLDRVVFMDDRPEMLERNYGNHLPIAPYEGGLEDTELLDVLPSLEWISRQPNLRSIDKRSWRSWTRS